tara:strand:- start:183 stop:377 length:195 start_codon:yes stop_codon:yes gene_type:complete
MKKALFIFCLLLTFSVFSQEEKRLALVIGNANKGNITKKKINILNGFIINTLKYNSNNGKTIYY